jgi:hypothetical protein
MDGEGRGMEITTRQGKNKPSYNNTVICRARSSFPNRKNFTKNAWQLHDSKLPRLCISAPSSDVRQIMNEKGEKIRHKEIFDVNIDTYCPWKEMFLTVIAQLDVKDQF